MTMRTGTLLGLLLAAASLTGCGDTTDEPEVINEETGMRDYPAFEGIDPYTHGYFIELEGTGLADSQGKERLYNLGINVCQRLDAGQTVEQQLADDAGLGDQMGSIVGAAVTHLCPQHSEAVENYLATRD